MGRFQAVAAAGALAAMLCACAGGQDWRRDYELGDRALRHGRLDEADADLQAALLEAGSGSRNMRLARTLNALGDLRAEQENFSAAEVFYRHALPILEKTTGPKSRETGAALSILGQTCQAQKKNAQAETFLRRAVDAARSDPKRGAELATRLEELASFLHERRREDEAESFYHEALSVTEKVFGPRDPTTARRLDDAALFEQGRGHNEEAEALYRRALQVKEKILGPGAPEVIGALNNLALLDEALGRDTDAESLYARALAEGERVHGRRSFRLTTTLEHYVHLLRRLGKPARAAELEAQLRQLARPPKTAADTAVP